MKTVSKSVIPTTFTTDQSSSWRIQTLIIPKPYTARIKKRSQDKRSLNFKSRIISLALREISSVNSPGRQATLIIVLSQRRCGFFRFSRSPIPFTRRMKRRRSECRRISQSRGNDVTRGCRLGCPKLADRFRSVSLNWAIQRRPHVRVSVPPPWSPPLPTIPLPFPLSGRNPVGTGECVSAGSK